MFRAPMPTGNGEAGRVAGGRLRLEPRRRWKVPGRAPLRRGLELGEEPRGRVATSAGSDDVGGCPTSGDHGSATRASERADRVLEVEGRAMALASWGGARAKGELGRSVPPSAFEGRLRPSRRVRALRVGWMAHFGEPFTRGAGRRHARSCPGSVDTAEPFEPVGVSSARGTHVGSHDRVVGRGKGRAGKVSRACRARSRSRAVGGRRLGQRVSTRASQRVHPNAVGIAAGGPEDTRCCLRTRRWCSNGSPHCLLGSKSVGQRCPWSGDEVSEVRSATSAREETPGRGCELAEATFRRESGRPITRGSGME